jgi:hypothetical protein
VQIETSVAEFTRDRHNPEREELRQTAWSIGSTNVRVGLTARSELQFVMDGYRDVESRSPDTTERRRGLGDLTVRAKWNLWGNDEGVSALGLMPFVKLPTAREGLGNDSVEGGFIVPYASDLGSGWGFGAMTEIVVRNDADDGHASIWVNTATISRALTEKLGGFVEIATATGEGKPVATANWGLTYAVDENLQLDLGVNIGLTRSADDLTLFTGFVKRY